MKIEDRFSLDGVTVVLRNTMRQDVRRETMYQTLGKPIFEGPEGDHRAIWLIVNAFTVSVKGLKWEPSVELAPDALEASYQSFMDTVPRELADFWYGKIRDLRVPLADLIERRDNQLTEAQKADPNS